MRDRTESFKAGLLPMFQAPYRRQYGCAPKSTYSEGTAPAYLFSIGGRMSDGRVVGAGFYASSLPQFCGGTLIWGARLQTLDGFRLARDPNYEFVGHQELSSGAGPAAAMLGQAVRRVLHEADVGFTPGDSTRRLRSYMTPELTQAALDSLIQFDFAYDSREEVNEWLQSVVGANIMGAASNIGTNNAWCFDKTAGRTFSALHTAAEMREGITPIRLGYACSGNRAPVTPAEDRIIAGSSVSQRYEGVRTFDPSEASKVELFARILDPEGPRTHMEVDDCSPDLVRTSPVNNANSGRGVFSAGVTWPDGVVAPASDEVCATCGSDYSQVVAVGDATLPPTTSGSLAARQQEQSAELSGWCEGNEDHGPCGTTINIHRDDMPTFSLKGTHNLNTFCQFTAGMWSNA